MAGTEGVSLQATLLVHEALIRLSGRTMASFTDETHLLAVVAQSMRHVIVDHMRRKLAAKRNGGMTVSSAGNVGDFAGVLDTCGPARTDLAIDLDQALNELADIDSQMRVIVELHVYGGIPLVEIAALMDSSERTIRRRWQFAAAILRQKLDAWNVNFSDESQ